MVATAKDAADDVIARAKAVLALDAPPHSPVLRSDIRRAALTMAVGALDTYMHWRIRQVPLTSPVPAALARVEVTLGDLIAMGERSLSARQDGRNDRPTTRARNVLNERLLYETFQNYEKIATGFKMLGVGKGWDKVSRDMATRN